MSHPSATITPDASWLARLVDKAPERLADGQFESLCIRAHPLKGAAASLPRLRAEFEGGCVALTCWAANPDGS